MSPLTAHDASSIAGDPTASVGRARPEAGDVHFHLLAALSGGGDADKVASIVRANTPGDVLDVHAPLAMVGADGYFTGWSTTVGLFTFVKAVEIALHVAAAGGIVGAATSLARLAGDVYSHLLAALSGGGDADKVASIVRANTPGDVLDVHAPLAMVGADGYFTGWSTTVGLFTFVKAVEIDNQAILQLLLDYNVDINTVDQNGRNALHVAAAGGIVGAATSLARLVASLNVADKYGETALHFAAANGHCEVVTALLGATGKDGVAVDLNVADEDGLTALLFAAINGHDGIVTALLGMSGKDGVALDLNVADKDGDTALLLAAINGHDGIVTTLVGATGKDGVGVDLNVTNKDGNTALLLAAGNGHAGIVTVLVGATGKDGVAVDLNVANKNGQTALHCAAVSGHAGIVTALVGATGKNGVAVDLNVVEKYGQTALLMAASIGHAGIVTVLVGATGKDGVAVDLNGVNKSGLTALLRAADNGHDEVVTVLVGAIGKDGVAVDLNVANKHGTTALHCAASNGHCEVVTALVGATGKDGVAVDLNGVNKHGQTALHCAASNGHAGIVTVLVGATGKDGVAVDLNVVDINGSTALHYAAANGHDEFVTTLVGVTGKDGVAVDLNVVAKNGWTALTAAIAQNHIAVVKMLLDRHAHVGQCDFDAAVKFPAIHAELTERMPKKSCAACKDQKYPFQFAKAQLKKSAANRKCTKCVESGRTTASAKSNADAKLLVCSVCAASKPHARFSKAQRGKKDARKCSDCIAEADLKQKEAAAATAAASLLDGEAVAPPTRKKGGAKVARTQKADAAALHVRADQNDGKRAQAARDHETTKQQRAAKIKAEKAAEHAKEAEREAEREATRAAIRHAEWRAAEAAEARKLASAAAPVAANASSAAATSAPSTAKLPPRSSPKTPSIQTLAAAPSSAAAAAAWVPVSTPAQTVVTTGVSPLPTAPPLAPAPAPASSAHPSPPPPQQRLLPLSHEMAAIPPLLELDPACLTATAGAVLGSGSFATVIGGTYVFPVHGATPVAIKVFHGTAGGHVGTGEAAALAELMTSTRVSVNPHLVQMYGAARLPGHGLCLVMERIAGQSLRIVLDTQAVALPWDLRIRWLFEIAQGMQAMHEHKPTPILHRDLKASNVLLDSANVGVAHAKIADFGVAKAVDTLVVDTCSRGASEWSAPEALDGQVSFPIDVYSYGVLTFEVLSRLAPYSNISSKVKIKIVSLQIDCAKFEYDEDIFEDEDADEDLQRNRWEKKRAKTFIKRRPDLTLLSKDSPKEIVGLMTACWLDDAADRPVFAEVVSTLGPLALASSSASMIGGGGGGGFKEQSVPKLSIYSISSDVFQKANSALAEEGLSREKAAEIFKNELAGTLERLFKAIVTQHRLPTPAQKAVGLGTYYRTIKNGPAFVGDASIVQAMDKFCSQRNQVIHEDVLPNVATIRQHALTCSKMLRLLHDIYPM